MPRTPDPQLELRVTKAALRLLDAGGLPAITLRAIAREACTTTTTIYERFADRDQLVQSLRHEAETGLAGALGLARDVTGFVRRYVEFNVRHPQRFELTKDTFGFRLAEGEPMPIYELLKEQLTNEIGVHGAKREQLAMAIASLALGTTRAILAAGSDTVAAKDLQRTCRLAVQLLLKAFSEMNTATDNAP